MKFRVDHQRRSPIRSGDAMAKIAEGETPEDITTVKEELVKTKKEFEHWLTVKFAPDTGYYRQYSQAVIGLRLIFPDEPEMSQITELVQKKFARLLPDAFDPPPSFKHILNAGWTVDNILMNNPLAIQELFGSNKRENPQVIEYLHRFAKARQEKKYLMMVELGLVCNQLYPDTTDQVRRGVQDCWTNILHPPTLEEDIPGWLELVAKGLLVHPGLRDEMDVHSPFFKNLKRQAMHNHSAQWLMWLKIIQAEDVQFNEQHQLVITPQQQKIETKHIPLPARAAI